MGFELDEILFTKISKFLKNRKENNKEILLKQVKLEEVQSRLTLIARAITGEAIEIFPAEKEGGYKDQSFFLPTKISFFNEPELNRQFYVFRTVYLSVQKKLKFNWLKEEESHENSLKKAEETSSMVLKEMFADFPNLEGFYHQILEILPLDKKKNTKDYSWIYGKWMKNSEENSAKSEDFNNNKNDAEKIANNPKTTLKSKAVEEIINLTIDQKQQEDYVLLHNFEKIETAEEFNGNWRDFDGKDELEDHQDALDDLNMKFTVRSAETTHSVYQAEFMENTNIAESNADETSTAQFYYDEWDFKNQNYKKDFCKVFEKKLIGNQSLYYKNTLHKYRNTLVSLRKILTSIHNKRQVQNRLNNGEEYDIDALTDFYTAILGKITPDEKIYLSKRNKNKDIAIILLIDSSLSSDAYAAGNRVIDIAKEVSILFGEILNEFNIEFAIDAFNSKTRNHTNYIVLKDFKDSWDSAKFNISELQPDGYTRIGTAIRHAGNRLEKTESENRWLILLSDGKPNDYDKYEGQYGIQDTKQALRENKHKNINSYAIAIEAQAKYYLPQMFGINHYEILSNTHDLIESLVKFYTKIKNEN